MSNAIIKRHDRTIVPNGAARAAQHVLSAFLLLRFLTDLCCVSLLTVSCSSSICFFFITYVMRGAMAITTLCYLSSSSRIASHRLARWIILTRAWYSLLVAMPKAKKQHVLQDVLVTSTKTVTAELGASAVKSPVAATMQVGAVLPMNIIAMIVDPAMMTTMTTTETDLATTATKTDSPPSAPSRNEPGLLPLIPMALCTCSIPDLDFSTRRKATSTTIQNHATTTLSRRRRISSTVRSRNLHFVKCPHSSTER